MREETLRYYEKVASEDPIIRLVGLIGIPKTAEELKISVEELSFILIQKRSLWDYEFFASEYLWIVSKAGILQKLVYNRGQKKILQAIEKQKILGKPVRLALLKSRQFGGTTMWEGIIYDDTVNRDSRSSMIIAHSLESAEHIRSMAERYHDRYSLKKPPMKKQTEKWWKFVHTKGGKRAESSIRIDTAENISAGHSFTLHNLHCSEIQAWGHPDELIKGLMPTIPNSPDTMVLFEGTGSGVGSYWYDFCEMARSGQTDWEFVFVPWFEIEDYTLPFRGKDEESRFRDSIGRNSLPGGMVDVEEEALLKEGVTLEQLHWRRTQVVSTYKGDLDSFHQQYPSSPDEAFLTSGRPVFPAGLVKKKIAESKIALKIGNLRRKGEDVVFDEDPSGQWRIWRERDLTLENAYCLGADISEGIAVIPELGNRGGDYSATRVFHRRDRFFEATFHGRVDNDVFADELSKASIFWKCPVFPEQNAGGGGNVVIHILKKKGVRLLKTPNFGKRRDQLKDEYGWETMKNTKRMMIDELAASIREGDFEDPDREFWYEASTYVRDEKGRTNAQTKKFDDLVMASAITLQADHLMGGVFKKAKEEKVIVPRDFDVRKETKSLQEVMEENYVEF